MIQTFQVNTSSQNELIDITQSVRQAAKKAGIEDGFCIVFVPHTTAGITVNENADPSVRQDLLMELEKIVPFEDRYHHREGNSAAHIKASLLGCSQTILVESGRLVLGTWQGIFLCEFDGPKNRKVHVHAVNSRV